MTHDLIVTPLPPSGVVIGEERINFASHQARMGMQGAREDFENMISLLVRSVRPGARMIAANPGDWGIDVLVGDLGGDVVVWQSKYFFPIVKKDHQQEVRNSFNSVLKNARNEGFELLQWVLCVPSSMDAPTAAWWDKWKRKTERETGVMIQLWDETELRGLLLSPDADAVRRHFYEAATAQSRQVVGPGAAVVALDSDEAERLEAALFVRQLREAGHVEVSSSKQQFFNAELMAREIVDKGVPAEVAALSSADAWVHGLWEEHFNDACQANENVLLPGLHKDVMKQIRAEHAALAAGLPGGPVHACGLMHRVVDNRRAGWVRHWRHVAEEHGSLGAGRPQEEPDGIEHPAASGS